MLPAAATRTRAFERIADPSGRLSMVAMDQRESLRTMFEKTTREPVPDSTLVDFKLSVAETLSPHASAMLLDRLYGTEAMRALAPSCGLVVAADQLQQPAGEIVQETRVDTNLDLRQVAAWGGAALKFLVLWRRDDRKTQLELTRRFLEMARSGGLLAIVEGVVRPPRSGSAWDREEAILQAAQELGALGPDLYKAEVPLSGRGDPEEMRRRCRAITDALPCPWVVLSSGVAIEDFPGAVQAACQGGASGFLAGRGIWMDLVGPGDYRSRLSELAVPRLTALRAIVERHARPWWEGVPA